jgi:DNA-binding MarR family transcriptional regulator
VTSIRDEDYRRLLGFRTALRRFLRWSEGEARAAGLTPAQHQLLLAVKGHPDPAGPTIGEVADYLVVRHHSVVELVDRAAGAGLIRRARDETDHRAVRVLLTPQGERAIEKLSRLHLEEIRRLAPLLSSLEDGGLNRPTRGPAPPRA